MNWAKEFKQSYLNCFSNSKQAWSMVKQFEQNPKLFFFYIFLYIFLFLIIFIIILLNKFEVHQTTPPTPHWIPIYFTQYASVFLF